MSDDNVVDMKSRRRRNDNPSVLGLAEQLIAMEGIIETVAVLADVSHDFHWLQLFEGIPDTPEVRDRVWDIIREAVVDLVHLEDSLREQVRG
jgi:hypothetical protein